MTEIEEISIDELAKLDLENICLVDVREEYEFIEMRAVSYTHLTLPTKA